MKQDNHLVVARLIEGKSDIIIKYVDVRSPAIGSETKTFDENIISVNKMSSNHQPLTCASRTP